MNDISRNFRGWCHDTYKEWGYERRLSYHNRNLELENPLSYPFTKFTTSKESAPKLGKALVQILDCASDVDVGAIAARSDQSRMCRVTARVQVVCRMSGCRVMFSLRYQAGGLLINLRERRRSPRISVISRETEEARRALRLTAEHLGFYFPVIDLSAMHPLYMFGRDTEIPRVFQ